MSPERWIELIAQGRPTETKLRTMTTVELAEILEVALAQSRSASVPVSSRVRASE